MKREYVKNNKSFKWSEMRRKYMQKCDQEKAKFYENIVKDLKISNSSLWYSKLKRSILIHPGMIHSPPQKTNCIYREII